jgi:hypothetical protein
MDKCVIIYNGVPQESKSFCGVAMSFNQREKMNLSYIWFKERIMLLRFKIYKGYVCITGLYDPKIVEEKSQKNIKLRQKKILILLIRIVILFRWI